jgi:hypothetical protein
MLARRFACFGWRIANRRLHASTFRVATALRQQSTVPSLNIDDIVGGLAKEELGSTDFGDKGKKLKNESIRTVAEIYADVQASKKPLDDAALQKATEAITSQLRLVF